MCRGVEWEAEGGHQKSGEGSRKVVGMAGTEVSKGRRSTRLGLTELEGRGRRGSLPTASTSSALLHGVEADSPKSCPPS